MSLLTTLQKFPDELETQATNSDYLPEPNKPFLTGTLVTFANSFSSTFTTFQYFAGPRAFSMVFSQFSTPPAQGLCSYLFFFFFLGCTFPDLCGSLSSFSLNAASLEKTYLIILVKFVPLAIPPFYSAQFYSFISRITIEMNCISVCVYYLSLLLDFNLHELETLSSCSLQLLQSYMWHILSMKTVCEMDPDWTENVIYSSFLTYLSAFPVTWWPQYLTQT